MSFQKKKKELENQISNIQYLSSYIAEKLKPIQKATTIGVIIDCTPPYLSLKNLFTVKLQLIDPTFNVSVFNPQDKSTYLTVYIQNVKNQQLPHPRMIGDILYLKRFKFSRYNEQFQAFNYPKENYCSWTLFHGDADCTHLEPYETSKQTLQFKQEQEYNLRLYVKDLRLFTSSFFKIYSVLTLHPYKYTSKDVNLIVKVLKKKSEEGYVLSDGTRELFLPELDSFVEERKVAKLRSAIRIEKGDEIDQIVASQFTSLIMLPKDSFDEEMFYRKSDLLLKTPEEKEIFTSLRTVLGFNSSDCLGRKFNIKVEVCSIFPENFSQILKYYHRSSKKIFDDKPTEAAIDAFGEMQPIYFITLVCCDFQDLDMMTELYVLSYDGKCKDFVPNVNLEEDLTEYSNLTEENYYYQQKRQKLLNAESVSMVIEVNFDDQGEKKILRVVRINKIK